MKKFFLNAFLFALPILVILIMLEALARNMPSELYEEKKQYIEENISKIELMVLGTSQVTCSVNPDYISIPSINMANGSQSYEYDYYLLDHYIDRLTNLKYVMLELSYQSLYFDMIVNNGFRSYYYYMYYGFPNNTEPFSIKRYSVFLIEPNRTMTRMFQYYSDIEKWKEDNYSSKGWFNMNGNFDGMTPDQVMRDGEEKYKYHWRRTFENNYLPKNYEIIEKIIALCQQKKVQVILVTPPVYKSFSDNIWIEKYNEMQEIVRKLQKDHGVAYYNFFYDERFDFGDFYNHNHMNGNGAKKLSLILNEILTDTTDHEKTQSANIHHGMADASGDHVMQPNQ